MALFHTTVVDNQIKALDTIGSASGSIATFETDKAENLINLEVAITATGGGGTPVSPISINGYSQAVVNACGKNLFDIQNAPIINGTIGAISFSYSSASGSYVMFLPKGKYVIYISNPNTTICRCCTINQYPTGTSFNISNNNFNAVNATSATFTVNNTSDSWLVIQTNRATIDTRSSDIQVELGTIATTYEPYNGTTETIPFGQTVYGGRLNVGSGVLTVTHAIYRAVDNNNITLYGSSTNNNVFRIVTGLYATLIGQLCNIATYNANAYQANDDRVNTFQMSDTGNVYIQLSKTVANTLNDFKTYILNNDIDIYYELATPTTIQLDSKQIQTIANSVNNIYADTGDIIDLKFVLSVGKAIS